MFLFSDNLIFIRSGLKTEEQSGEKEKGICCKILILEKDLDLSLMVWCSHSLMIASLPMVTLDTTIGRPKYHLHHSPRVLHGVSTLHSCIINQGKSIKYALYTSGLVKDVHFRQRFWIWSYQLPIYVCICTFYTSMVQSYAEFILIQKFNRSYFQYVYDGFQHGQHEQLEHNA